MQSGQPPKPKALNLMGHRGLLLSKLLDHWRAICSYALLFGDEPIFLESGLPSMHKWHRILGFTADAGLLMCIPALPSTTTFGQPTCTLLEPALFRLAKIWKSHSKWTATHGYCSSLNDTPPRDQNWLSSRSLLNTSKLF